MEIIEANYYISRFSGPAELFLKAVQHNWNGLGYSTRAWRWKCDLGIRNCSMDLFFSKCFERGKEVVIVFCGWCLFINFSRFFNQLSCRTTVDPFQNRRYRWCNIFKCKRRCSFRRRSHCFVVRFEQQGFVASGKVVSPHTHFLTTLCLVQSLAIVPKHLEELNLTKFFSD